MAEPSEEAVIAAARAGDLAYGNPGRPDWVDPAQRGLARIALRAGYAVDVAPLEARVELLKSYVTHDPDCSTRSALVEGECNCGLAEVLHS